MPSNNESTSYDDNLESLKEEIMNSSSFQFPIPGISLVLPNDTKCTLEGFTFIFQADGTVMHLKGNNGAGILIDNYPLIRTTGSNNDGKTHVASHWIVDFISSTFTLQSTQEDGDVAKVSYDNVDFSMLCAYIRCSPTIVSRFTQGMNQVLDSASDFQMPSSGQVETPGDTSLSPPSKSKWSVDIRQSIQVELEDEQGCSTREWIQMALGPTFFFVPMDSDCVVNCGGIKLGPTSLGKVESRICKFTKNANADAIIFSDTISANLDSVKSLWKIQSFLSRFAFSSNSSDLATSDEPMTDTESSESAPFELPFSAKMNHMILQVEEPCMSMVMDDVSASGSTVAISKVGFTSEDGMEVNVRGINTTLGSDIELDLDEVNELHIPGTFKLVESLVATRIIKFQNGTVGVRLTTLRGRLLNKDNKRSSDIDGQSGDSKILLPFPVNLFVEELMVTEDSEAGEGIGKKQEQRLLHVKKGELDVKVPAPEEPETIYAMLDIGFAKNNLVEVSSANLRAKLNPNALDMIEDLRVSFDSPLKVVTGYSAVDWKGMFSLKRLPKKKKSVDEPIKLPLVEITEVDIQLLVDFKILSQNDLITFSAFHGDENTTGADLQHHYITKIKKQAPGMITNTEVLGVNVLNTGMTQYGALALHATSYGGAVVGLASVVGK